MLAAPALITMLPVVAGVSDPSVALKVYVPTVVSLRLLNVATPFTAVAVSVLPAAKPPGPLCTAIVTVELFDITIFPLASSMVTLSALNWVPAVPEEGVVVNATCVGGADMVRILGTIALAQVLSPG